MTLSLTSLCITDLVVWLVVAGSRKPDRGSRAGALVIFVVSALVAVTLALAVNLLTNRVPRSWHWASNGFLLAGVAAGLAVVGGVLAWWQWRRDAVREHFARPWDEPSGRRDGWKADRDERPLQRWQLWMAAVASSALAAGLAALAHIGGPGKANDVTAVLIVVVGLVGLTVALVLRVSREPVRPDDGQRSFQRRERAITPRQVVLDKVDRWWIQDGLRRSLQQAVRLDVELDRQPDALADGFGDEWGTGLLQRLGAGEPLPPGTRLAALLRGRSHWRCLVVGDPGSGKTTHLLEFAEDLLARARTSARAPVPLVLLLSRWTGGHSDLISWASAEISERYDVAPADINEWLAEGSVALLLDGLDEVGPDVRPSCLRALNDFARDPACAHLGLVLTCRTHDYESMPERLRFDIAVRVRHLSAEQVDHALTMAGPGLSGLRQALARDRVIAELLTTPLMLGVAVLAYHGAAPGTPTPTGNPDRVRDLVYEAFVQRMLIRDRSLRRGDETPPPGARFEPEQMYFALVWLAKIMQRQQQTVFYPDWLTPAWLPNRQTQWPVPRTRGLAALAATRLGWDHASTGIVGARLAGLIGAAVAAPIGALAGGLKAALLAAGGFGILLSLCVGLTFGVLLQIRALDKFLALIVGTEEEDPYAASAWAWSWPQAARGLLARSALAMLVAGAALASPLGWHASIAIALVLGFGGALSAGTIPDHTEPPASPGRALSVSLWRYATLLLLLTTVALLAAAIAFALDGPWAAIITALPLTAALMLTAGPGRAWLRNRAVHYGMVKSQLLPRDLLAFLHYADERVIMQRIFGGYAFTHRTLRDYLAGQRPATVTSTIPAS